MREIIELLHSHGNFINFLEFPSIIKISGTSSFPSLTHSSKAVKIKYSQLSISTTFSKSFKVPSLLREFCLFNGVFFQGKFDPLSFKRTKMLSIESSSYGESTVVLKKLSPENFSLLVSSERKDHKSLMLFYGFSLFTFSWFKGSKFLNFGNKN